MSKPSIRKAIKRDLLDQLEVNCTVGAYYTDLVDDYIALWETKNALIADIRKRGPQVDYISNSGVINKKKNESISELVKVNAQMVKLLTSLGISPSQAEAGDDDEM